jgi:hypothetical protein
MNVLPGCSFLRYVDRTASDMANLWSFAVSKTNKSSSEIVNLVNIFISLGCYWMVSPTFLRFLIIRWILFDYFTLWLAILYMVMEFILDDWMRGDMANTANVMKVSVQLLKSNLSSY